MGQSAVFNESEIVDLGDEGVGVMAGDGFAAMLEKKAKEKGLNKTIADAKKSDKKAILSSEKFSIRVDVTSSRIEAFQNELLGKYPGKTSDISLHSVYESYAEILEDNEAALDLAIKDYEDHLKKCK